jgi:hypothetical protein
VEDGILVVIRYLIRTGLSDLCEYYMYYITGMKRTYQPGIQKPCDVNIARIIKGTMSSGYIVCVSFVLWIVYNHITQHVHRKGASPDQIAYPRGTHYTTRLNVLYLVIIF